MVSKVSAHTLNHIREIKSPFMVWVVCCVRHKIGLVGQMSLDAENKRHVGRDGGKICVARNWCRPDYRVRHETDKLNVIAIGKCTCATPGRVCLKEKWK